MGTLLPGMRGHVERPDGGSPMMCKQSPGGDYCQGYLEELRFGYLMYRDLMGLVQDRPELQEELDQIWDQNWNRINSIQ